MTPGTVKLTIKTNQDTYQQIKSVEVTLKLGSKKRLKECLGDEQVLLNHLGHIFSNLDSKDVASEGSGGNENVWLGSGKEDGVQRLSVATISWYLFVIMRKSSTGFMNSGIAKIFSEMFLCCLMFVFWSFFWFVCFCLDVCSENMGQRMERIVRNSAGSFGKAQPFLIANDVEVASDSRR